MRFPCAAILILVLASLTVAILADCTSASKIALHNTLHVCTVYVILLIQNELSIDFKEVIVKWVDCPDLTQEPFNLAAPGLCGDTALLDIGGISNLFPLPKTISSISFKQILQELHRTQSNELIIGGGYCSRAYYLNNLIMNALFSPTVNGMMAIRNKSRYTFAKTIRSNEIIDKPLTNNLNCKLYGNFFISKGLREQVLKIQVRKRKGRDFINALQHAIRRFPQETNEQIIGFGGVFLVKNGTTIYHIIRRDWTDSTRKENIAIPITKENIDKCVKYRGITEPTVALATFINTDKHIIQTESEAESNEIFLTRMNAHVYSNTSNNNGCYYRTELDDNSTEYLGYFSPATKLYRINPVPMFHEIPYFSCL